MMEIYPLQLQYDTYLCTDGEELSLEESKLECLAMTPQSSSIGCILLFALASGRCL